MNRRRWIGWAALLAAAHAALASSPNPTKSVSVTDTPQQLVAAEPHRFSFLIENTDQSNSVAYGDSTVTYETGIILPAGQAVVVGSEMGAAAEWYVVGPPSATEDVRVCEWIPSNGS